MSESFEQLFKESLDSTPMRQGAIIKGTVVEIKNDYVVINAGLKSEGVVPIDQFYNHHRELEVQVGDEVEVALDAVENGYGETRLSREKAKRAETWDVLSASCENNETVKGVILNKVKGGFTVDLSGIRAFLPGSLVDVRPARDVHLNDGEVLDLKVIKLDPKRNNVVVSRRAVMEEANSAEREAILSQLKEGDTVKGIVKNLTDYGAFIDLGGVDGLLHITDIAWRRIKHPSEVIKMGDEIDVKVLKYDPERKRVSLGLKQLAGDPWTEVANQYPVGTKLSGEVTNIADYGFFVAIKDGIEGLVHVSEIDWTNKNIHPSKVVQLGDEVNVMVLEIDPDRRRISLGMKQCSENPWEKFASSHEKGEKIKGAVKSITDFGIFIGLEDNIDGLIHLSDISWDEPGEKVVRNFTKGEELEAVILAIDPERERISLGLKQLSDDPLAQFLTKNEEGAILSGKVTEVDPKFAMVELEPGVHGILRAAEASRKRIEDMRKRYKAGDEIEAQCIGIDRKTRAISLSIKAIELEEEQAIKDYSRKAEEAATSTTLGDILKGSMDSQSDEK